MTPSSIIFRMTDEVIARDNVIAQKHMTRKWLNGFL
jgi:hypothetical protein